MLEIVAGLKEKKKALDDLFANVSELIQGHSLKECEEPILVDLINKIKRLGLELQDLVSELNKIES